ncbi:unnamed protein product [marine sediment metagenome]|uniref:Uncharacterized protein n=1 Tax=marine sediment metagenome TaxID=412755 RepID=X1PI41_9ZZZZ
MSEEQLREAVKRTTEETKQPQEAQPPETSWSVPPSTLLPRIELPETDFEPLQPLEPADLGEAIAQSFAPQTPEYGEILLPDVEEGVRIPMNRPAAPLMGNVCPHGLPGNCIWCDLYPCDYMLKRTLRFLITMVEYGEGRNKP